MRYTFDYVASYARSKGINMQRTNRWIGDAFYRYELFKTGAVVIEVRTLDEAISEINTWCPENK